MEGLQMSDSIQIRSRLKDYQVSFIKDPFNHFLHYSSPDVIFIIDDQLIRLYPTELQPIFDKYKVVLITVNEHNKTIDYAKEIIFRLSELDIRRNCTLIAIGGGITQDLVAFVASIIFRGIKWIFYPTTLLSQADSCIGSKSSINFDQFKNLLGTFNPPDIIFIAVSFLNTLPASEIRSGIGEILHYYLTKDLDLASELMSNFESIIKKPNLVEQYINKSLLIKKEIIEKDEFDTDLRHIFNYGHTFGHAAETVSNYKVPHGQAVTFGMSLANYISLCNNLISLKLYNDIQKILVPNLPYFFIDKSNISDYILALSKDKKNIGKKLGCILTKGPGHLVKQFLELDSKLSKQILDHSEKIKEKIICLQ